MTPTALFTDFYELTMLAGYAEAGLAEVPATFDLFFRRPPRGVSFLIASGQELALEYLQNFSFSDEDLAYLRTTPLPNRFVDSLAEFRFTGDVWAVPEGTPVFPDEPVLRIDAPLVQAQVVETALLNLICYSSLVASNAAEVRMAAQNRTVLEFGARRAHGPDGARTASRSAYLGGCDATSNVEAGAAFDIPIAGTQAHAWVMAFPSELESFRAYAEAFPDNCTLLVDTYDTLGVGVPNAITVAHEMAKKGHSLNGIRLDSGDLNDLSHGARDQLDAAGLHHVKIVASGDLDAERITQLIEEQAPIDVFGVGTALVTAKKDPTISGVYKLAHIGNADVAKVSSTPAKMTSPGRKQVWRSAAGDVIGLEDESHPGEPMLHRVMENGVRVNAPVPLHQLRERSMVLRADLASASPDGVVSSWPVRRSDRLDALRTAVTSDLADGARDLQ